MDNEAAILSMQAGSSGPNGSQAFIIQGNTNVARAFILPKLFRAVLCEHTTENQNDLCTHCRQIESQNHPDIITVEKDHNAQYIGIQQIRDFSRSMRLSHIVATKKFGVIYDAHQLHKSSANALLKILEEPPDEAILILTAENLESFPRTILSRCIILKISSMTASDPNQTIDEDLSELLRSSLHDQLRFVDQTIAKMKTDKTLKQFQISEKFKSILNDLEIILRSNLHCVVIDSQSTTFQKNSLRISSIINGLIALAKVRYTIRMNGNLYLALDRFFMKLHI